MRMCIGCREMMPKKELTRIVKSPEGTIDIDLKGKAPGRGAYLCNSKACVDKAAKHKLLEKNFEQKIDQEVYDRLSAYMCAKTQLNEGE